jgi:hypothetical protein
VNLENINNSYLILSSNILEGAVSVLYAKDYVVSEMSSMINDNYCKSIIAYGIVESNDLLRSDAVLLVNEFNIEYAIVKYKGDISPRKLYRDGSESLLMVEKYSLDYSNKTYIYKGFSFSFIEKKRYSIPSCKEDFKVGMIVEYFNSNKWCEKLIENPNVEWDKMYKLLLKYNKIRIVSSN